MKGIALNLICHIQDVFWIATSTTNVKSPSCFLIGGLNLVSLSANPKLSLFCKGWNRESIPQWKLKYLSITSVGNLQSSCLHPVTRIFIYLLNKVITA